MSIKSLASLTKIFFLILVRGRTLLTLILSISIPIAISISLATAISIIYEQAKLATDIFLIKPLLNITYYPHENCINIKVTKARIEYGEKILYIQIHSISDINNYLMLTDTKIIKKKNNTIFFSIGIDIANIYGIDIDKNVVLYVNNKSISIPITAIHRGREYINYIALASWDLELNGTNAYLCKEDFRDMVKNILYSISLDIEAILRVLSIAIPLSYTPILYFAISKTINSYRNEIKLFYSLGIAEKTLRLYFILPFLVLVYILVLYGISLGVISIHLAIWFLKLVSISIVIRPLPTIEVIIIQISLYILSTLVFLVIHFKKIGEFM